MNNKELTSLAIRVFAIYVFVQAILLIAQSGSGYQSFFQGDHKWLFLIPAMSVIGLFVTFYFLWKMSNRVFNEITKQKSKDVSIKIDQFFILQLLGLYLIVIGLLNLGQSGVSLYYTNVQQASEYGSTYNPEMSSQAIYYAITSILKFILGITLLTKSKGWTKFLNRFRSLGLSSK